MVFSIRARLLLSLVSPDELRLGPDFFNSARAAARFWRNLSKCFVHDLLDLLAQPAVWRIVLCALVPVHMDLKLLQALQRKRIQPMIETSVEHLRVMLRDGQEHVRFAHYAARSEIMLAAQNDAALAAGAIQFSIHQAGTETSRRDKSMVLSEVRIQIELSSDGWMSFTRHDDHAIGK